MSAENFEKFRSLVLSDVDLQKELSGIENKKVFVNRVIELGAEKGFIFSAADVEDAIAVNRRGWVERWI